MRGACTPFYASRYGLFVVPKKLIGNGMLLQADKALLFLVKESPAGGLRRSIRQTDTICLCGAGRPVRHDPVASPQDGTPTKQVSDKTEP